jgi:hypothetical protein
MVVEISMDYRRLPSVSGPMLADTAAVPVALAAVPLGITRKVLFRRR